MTIDQKLLFGEHDRLLLVLLLFPLLLNSSQLLLMLLVMDFLLPVVLYHWINSLYIESEFEQLEESVSDAFVKQFFVLDSPFDGGM